jgi:hypothetical protein
VHHLSLIIDGVQGITEISGEAGTGKTQFALRLALQVQLPAVEGGLDGAALYISSEGKNRACDETKHRVIFGYTCCRPSHQTAGTIDGWLQAKASVGALGRFAETHFH